MKTGKSSSKATALTYIRQGYAPVPIPRGQKAPRLRGWQKLRLSESDVTQYFDEEMNVGLLLGKPGAGLIDVDLDAPEAVQVADQFLPATGMVHGRAGKPSSHFWYRLGNPPPPTKFMDVDGTCLLEIRSTGQQTLTPPSIHPSGERLRWFDEGSPKKLKLQELVRAASEAAACSMVARHWPATGSRNDAALALAGVLVRAGWPVAKATRFLKAAARAARDEEYGSRGNAVAATAEKFSKDNPVTGATRLREILGDAVVARLFEWLEISPFSVNPETEHLTDLGNARRFVAQHGGEVRFCFSSKRWYVWNGRRWKLDESGAVERKAKKTVMRMYEEAAAETNDELRKALGKWAQNSESRGHIVAMIELAKSEAGVPVDLSELDADPWLLNVWNGTIDLRTGELRKHRRDDLSTKLVPIEYDHDAQCPRFKKFLRRIFADNQALINFLQRSVGYCLTGSTREQVIFILWGRGANGKTTLIEVICDCLGDYSRSADSSLLLTRKSDGIRNDVARLAGARFVSTAETEAGRLMAETLVKQLSGGDKVTARFLYSEFFEFNSQFKLFLATNHKPVIRGTDNAIWRRIKLIPFEVTIPEKEQDKSLPQKLRAELPGILAWAVRGCLRWQTDGLGQPEQVLTATQEYREEMDTLGAFVKDRCITQDRAKVRSGELYIAYKGWCESNGERALTQQKLGTALAERGLKPYRTGRERGWTGVRLSDASDGSDANFGITLQCSTRAGKLAKCCVIRVTASLGRNLEKTTRRRSTKTSMLPNGKLVFRPGRANGCA